MPQAKSMFSFLNEKWLFSRTAWQESKSLKKKKGGGGNSLNCVGYSSFTHKALSALLTAEACSNVCKN